MGNQHKGHSPERKENGRTYGCNNRVLPENGEAAPQ